MNNYDEKFDSIIQILENIKESVIREQFLFKERLFLNYKLQGEIKDTYEELRFDDSIRLLMYKLVIIFQFIGFLIYLSYF